MLTWQRGEYHIWFQVECKKKLRDNIKFTSMVLFTDVGQGATIQVVRNGIFSSQYDFLWSRFVSERQKPRALHLLWPLELKENRVFVRWEDVVEKLSWEWQVGLSPTWKQEESWILTKEQKTPPTSFRATFTSLSNSKLRFSDSYSLFISMLFLETGV